MLKHEQMPVHHYICLEFDNTNHANETWQNFNDECCIMQELSRNTVVCLIFGRLIRLAKIKFAKYNPCIGTYNARRDTPQILTPQRSDVPKSPT